MRNIEKDLRGQGGFLHVLKNQLSFLFALGNLISCAHHQFHYFEGPKPLKHELDVGNMMKMSRCAIEWLCCCGQEDLGGVAGTGMEFCKI